MSRTDCHGMVGNGAAMQAVFELIDLFGPPISNVLIQGETGTGKELVARALHARSPRAEGPLVALPCGAIPEKLAESELFGHEAGAFTSAYKRRRGRVELAEGGTLYLDDVDDLSLGIQAKLLRVIQERSFERVGGERTKQANVRVIASTKVNLVEAVQEGRFREDLYYRLHVLVIPLPPLREHMEDIPALVQHFLQTLSAETGQPEKRISAETLACLMKHEWPGNIRQLRHAIEHAIAVSPSQTIRPCDLPIEALPTPRDKAYHLFLENSEVVDFKDIVRNFELDLLHWALDKAGGNQGKAARLLRIPRSTLQNKLRAMEEASQEYSQIKKMCIRLKHWEKEAVALDA